MIFFLKRYIWIVAFCLLAFVMGIWFLLFVRASLLTGKSKDVLGITFVRYEPEYQTASMTHSETEDFFMLLKKTRAYVERIRDHDLSHDLRYSIEILYKNGTADSIYFAGRSTTIYRFADENYRKCIFARNIDDKILKIVKDHFVE